MDARSTVCAESLARSLMARFYVADRGLGKRNDPASLDEKR
ncbi:hypothetical protein [Methylosinus sp. LW4]|nr:hypothetical protein [Methylosinus sp. LW4]